MAKELSDNEISDLIDKIDKIDSMTDATHNEVMMEIAKAVGLIDDVIETKSNGTTQIEAVHSLSPRVTTREWD